MRFLHPDGSVIHLSYCTNVHAAEDLDGVLSQLSRYAEPVRERLGTDCLGLGLWLARPVATRLLADRPALRTLRRELGLRGLEVVSLNAFPYAGFHAPSVKKDVYRPDWTTPERLSYTLDCARILAALLPDDARRGSVSTLPMAWREAASAQTRRTAGRYLSSLADGLGDLARRTGRTIMVGLEPEPGCMIESTDQAVELMAGLDRERIGVCLDTCHLAVGFEQPAEALRRLSAAGLEVVKTQASCALEAVDLSAAGRAALGRFAEQRFLHQTRERAADGRLAAVDDLPQALAGGLPGREPWRVHFHIPVHERPEPPLETTRPVLLDSLRALFGGSHAVTDHIEVETYTWSVLPGAREGDSGLVDGIAAELDWTRRALTALGLQPK
ncbi:xylose isomerase [Streptomyces sp. A244]|uniref:metabolite traffic protein EboE n=1 Tax=Streptomyces TaxID=1883 RepID=UPI000D1B807E|nr:metabolite traffic protein EboE [Streptomyces sp. A244]PTH90242.1 xylose isomerase [Streptomyces sp. A244]